ncbi:MAG: type II toxin-antitoxin system Phd/YefM family antitoxin [Defluviitaleaceae bacterium]|nr:type II toxin-antitoxin system Phd/YefM family antitoxin [Defluviitaleaceae bacterium]
MNMTFPADAIIPITEATKHFRTTCDKTKQLGTTFIFKNNRPDIVMMDISRYEQLFSMLETLEHSEIAALVAERKADDNGKRIPLSEVIGE